MNAAMAALLFATPVAHAATLDEQIAELTRQSTSQQAQANQLRAQGDTLANKLASINNQAAALATQISLNRAKQQRLMAQIEDAKVRLAKNKAVLNDSVLKIYLESQVSPLEMLAASKNLSDYVDRQQYMDRIKDHIQEAADEIRGLKEELEKQQVAVENLIKQQGDLQQALAIQRSEAATVLAQTKGEEARYASMSKANKAKAAELERQQAAILASRFGSGFGAGAGTACGGGYPAKWCNVSFPSYVVDNWGMYARQCVSYTAFRVWASGRHMPYWGGHGDAKQWPGNAIADGIPVNNNPGNGNDGTVAVTTAGPYGHVMWVERNLGGGMIEVSQYNARFDGNYSRATISTAGLDFIHF